MKVLVNAAAEAEVRVIPAYAGEPFPLRLPEQAAEACAATWLYGRQADEDDVLVIGLGERERLTPETIRRAAGIAARKLLDAGRSSGLLIAGPTDGQVAPSKVVAEAKWLQAWLEGWAFGQYRYEEYRQATRLGRTVDLHLRAEDWQELTAEELEAVIRKAENRAAGVILTRNLVNDPPEKLHPEHLARWLEDYFAGSDDAVRVHVYRGEELVERQMNGLLAVGAGSPHGPALVEIAYESDPSMPKLVLIGKGVTFDMGGMNVKTSPEISDARMDMGGAAAVIGALDILIRERAKVNVTALLPIVDNLPGTRAMLPSSVIRYPNGLTVQVANTDGEGRLIIADALIHAASLGAKQVIDIATLTGNVGAALGLGLAGIWGDEEMTRELVDIGKRNGELLWPMPLVDEYESALKSDYADLRNVGTSPMAGAIIAALFIRRFVTKPMKWVHIDMAGTVQYKTDVGYSPVGATGYGARLLADYAVRYRALTRGDS